MKEAKNTTFLDACRRKKPAHIPIWFMRQAGRVLPLYRRIREKYGVLTICQTPELAAEVTLQAVKTLGVDAAILFADIMIPLLRLGVQLEIKDSVGPVIHKPFRGPADIKALRNIDPEKNFAYLAETIRIIQKELDGKVPLIGFAGAPFTLASYLIEGGPSKNFLRTKALMYQKSNVWQALMTRLTNITIDYLSIQARAGVDAIQLFDSWVGALGAEDYKTYVYPFTKKIFTRFGNLSMPLIHFGTNTAGFLKVFSSVGCDVVGIDWRITIGEAWKQIGPRKAIQGNLDPALLLGDFSLVKKRVDNIVDGVEKRAGFIFNVGHGLLPSSPLKNVIKLVEYVHRV